MQRKHTDTPRRTLLPRSLSARLRATILLAVAVVCGGCAPGRVASDAPLTPTTAPEELHMLTSKTIFFGHQSVGDNLLQGLSELPASAAGAQLTATQVADASGVRGAGLFHAYVGQNYDPLSKLRHFDELMRAGVADSADVALFKFCYVDFTQHTDVEALFAAYTETLDALVVAYPDTTFIHVTVPLMAEKGGLKAFARRVLGRYDESFGNLQRHRFNELLRAEYAGKEPLFDLAQVESTAPDGSTCQMTVDGTQVPCLVPAYTDDGGHLNAAGRAHVAAQFLVSLAALESPVR